MTYKGFAMVLKAATCRSCRNFDESGVGPWEYFMRRYEYRCDRVDCNPSSDGFVPIGVEDE